MSTTYKILGQVEPSDTSNADLYVVPNSKSTVVSTVVMTNTSSSNVFCRLFARKDGEAASTGNALIYDGTVQANDFKAMTMGITLGEGDILTVRTDVAGSMTFQAFGSEVG